MKTLFFSGRNLQQALLAASRQLGLPPEEIAYRPRERQGGFIKNPRTVIEVDPGSPRKAAPTPSPPSPHLPRPVEPVPPAVKPVAPGSERPVIPRDPVEAAREGIAQLAALAGLEVRPEVEFLAADNEVLVDLFGPGADRAAANQGEILDAIEHLLPRLVRGIAGATPLCRVDAAGFRAHREADLRRLALEAAETVRREGRAHALPEMNPAERRIIHLTLEADSTVTTASHGDGFLKSVTVSPA